MGRPSAVRPITTDPAIFERVKALRLDPEPLLLVDLADKVFNLDVLDFFKLIPNESVDLVLTDEPYAIAGTRLNLKSRKDIITDFEWDETDLPTCARLPWIYEAYRVLKTGGFLINFGAPEWVTLISDIMMDAGFHYRSSIDWLKTNPAPHFRRNNFISGRESIFIASKGASRFRVNFNFLGQREMVNWMIDTKCPNCLATYPLTVSSNYTFPSWFSDVKNWYEADVVEISPLTQHKSNHETEKPEWLITKLINIFSQAGNVIVDPFCGSGVVLKVTKALGRTPIGNDKQQKWVSFAQKRIEEIVYDLSTMPTQSNRIGQV